MLDPVTKPQEPNMPSQSTLGSCIFDSYIYSSFPKMNNNKHIDHNLLVRLGFFLSYGNIYISSYRIFLPFSFNHNKLIPTAF